MAVDNASVNAALVQVQPPSGGSPLDASIVSITAGGTTDFFNDATSETVVYQITPPGGSWSQNPDGIYTISLAGSRPTDLAGNSIANATVGTFSVNDSGSHLVITLAPPNPIAVGTPFNVMVALENTAGADLDEL